MPRARPQLSITLPRNFTFHYTEGEEPKTPEQETLEQETPALVPRSPQAYRIKRRSRPSISSITYIRRPEDFASNDIPVPTIETPELVETSRPLFQQHHTEPAEGFLAPMPTRRYMTAPRTPSAQRSPFLHDAWGPSNTKTPGESISRPLSACSLLSDSSDDSSDSLSSYPSMGGSCTSPESDAPDPFVLPSVHKGHGKEERRQTPRLVMKVQVPKIQVRWTSDMDRHLWGAYLVYLQDPTVTPFKMLPGVAPPLGVCHRVAREARRSWRGARIAPCKSSGGGSPDTIKASRSGSNTPTGLITAKPSSWPKSGAATRRRLRELCKKKPTIAPHYQRLLQARSPSPESSSSCSEPSSLIGSSPFRPQAHDSAFKTRDIQLSLTTSTATSMQPDGPLARLASHNAAGPPADRDWFNDPIVPWASPTTIPSDIGLGVGCIDESMETPQLGSPFGYHTWGPSRSRQHTRPTTSRAQSDAVAVNGPSLRSPVRLHDTFPYPSALKRRAQHQLEDELSPGGSNMRKNPLEDLFGGPAESRHRRVRSRGFSLGDVNSNGGRLESLFTPPSTYDEMSSPEFTAVAFNSGTAEPPSISNTVRRLGSPFAGVSSRPPRRSPRHMASASLSAYNPSNFSSIDQTLGQANHNDEMWKILLGS